MLIDDYMPEWDVREQHRIRIHASAEQVYGALRSADLAGHPLVRILLGLRALPAALSRGGEGIRQLWLRAARPITLAAFEEHGFSILAENPPWEILIGLEGAFWKISGELREIDPDRFRRQPVPPGLARAAWNFTISSEAPGVCRLGTETRVRVGDRAGLRFRLYWILVRPGSGLIRRMMLRRVRRHASRAAA